MLQLKDIVFNKAGKKIVNGVSCTFAPGKLNVVLGPNGAGKSTLLKICAGEFEKFSGEVLYDEKNINYYSSSGLAKIRAVLSQETEIAFALTVSEIVKMGRYCHYENSENKKDIDICQKAMAMLSITEYADRFYHTLSGGEKQRVLFAKALAQIWPENSTGDLYLLLDEPLTFLDIQHQIEFLELIKKLLVNPKLHVIAVIHDLNLAARFADTIILMQDGKIFAEGVTSEILTVSNIETVFKIRPQIIQHNGQTHLIL